jgi:predicted short-subunit dehydrogenase-like oxidoreductase (DUF2520 family)
VRQVPHYLIIGRGRLAMHIEHYFGLLGILYSAWHRDLSLTTLYASVQNATHILLLINDDAIQGFIDQHLNTVTHAYIIHCSGRLNALHAIGAHPLMTFNRSLYGLTDYQAIPFVIEEEAPSFSILFPDFQNPSVRIAKKFKDKYHALCTLSGNLTCYLWQQLFDRFATELALPKEIAYPYLKQQMQNLLQDSSTALTGPLVRNDHKTIVAHLNVLQHDHLKAIYQGFIESFRESKKEVR